MKYTFEELSNMHSPGNQRAIMPGDIVVTRIGDLVATTDHAPVCENCILYAAACGALHSICKSNYRSVTGRQTFLKLVRSSDVLEEL